MTVQALPATYNSEPFYKEQFALFVYQGFSPFLAAMKIWPSDNSFAYRISEQWKDDAYVAAHVEKLRGEAEAKIRSPTKEELIKDLRKRADGMDDKEFIQAFRLLAEMSGHIAKPEPVNVNVQQNVQNRVMVVTDHGSLEEWEEKAKAQHARLVGGHG